MNNELGGILFVVLFIIFAGLVFLHPSVLLIYFLIYLFYSTVKK